MQEKNKAIGNIQKGLKIFMPQLWKKKNLSVTFHFL